MFVIKQKHSKTEKFLRMTEVEFLDAEVVTGITEASFFETKEEAEVFLWKTTYFDKGYTIINMEEV